MVSLAARIDVRITQLLKDELEEFCLLNDVAEAHIVRMAVRQFLDRNKKLSTTN